MLACAWPIARYSTPRTDSTPHHISPRQQRTVSAAVTNLPLPSPPAAVICTSPLLLSRPPHDAAAAVAVCSFQLDCDLDCTYSPVPAMSLVVTLLTPTVLVLIAYRARFLTVDGCIAAWFVGAAVVDAGLSATLQLLVFFFLGSLTTKYKQKAKDAMMPYKEPAAPAAATTAAADSSNKPTKKEKKKGRTSQQVLATGLVPALFCLLRHVPLSMLPASPALEPLKYALSNHSLLYSTFMAVNLADTLASELGMLNPQPPMLVTQWRGTVAAGVDGGVSLLGTLASLLGGALIGLCAGDLHSLAVLTLCGVNGSLIDSLLGVWLQSQPSLDSTATKATSKSSSGHVTYQPRQLTVQQWASSNALVNLLSCSLTCLLHLLLVYVNEQYELSALPSLSLLDVLVLLYTCQPWVSVLMLDNAALLMIVVWSVVFYSHTVQLLLWWGVVLHFWALQPWMAGQTRNPAGKRKVSKEL